MSFDLASFDLTAAANEGVEFELKHPTEKTGLGMYMTVVGVDSDIFQTRQQALGNKRLKNKKQDRTMAEIEAENLDLLAGCIVGWRNIIVDKVEIPFSPSAAKDLLNRFKWIREQTDEVIGDRSAFLGD